MRAIDMFTETCLELGKGKLTILRFCSVPNCGKKHNGNGYCAMHRARWKRWGDPMKIGSCEGRIATEETRQKQRKAKWRNPTRIFSNTKPERFLKSILTINGIVYESQKRITGLPDLFIEPNICIFVDGCGVHGCPLHCKKPTDFQKNRIIKDERVNKLLTKNNYIVIRFWQHEIENNEPIKILDKIDEVRYK